VSGRWGLRNRAHVDGNVGATYASSHGQCVGHVTVIHRMFCHDRRQKVIKNDRLFNVGLPNLRPLTPFRFHPTFPASSQCRAPDSLAMDVRALYKLILHYITVHPLIPLPVAEIQLAWTIGTEQP